MTPLPERDGALLHVTAHTAPGENGERLSSEFFDAAGQLTRPAGGFAQILAEVEQDDSYETITTRYFNADGTPLIGGEGGAAVVKVYELTDALNKENGLEQKLELGNQKGAGSRNVTPPARKRRSSS